MDPKIKYVALEFYSRQEYFTDAAGSGIKQSLLIVDKENRHPDPLRKLIWGYDVDGQDVSGDFIRKFERICPNTLSSEEIKQARRIKYKVPPFTVHSQEILIRQKAILSWIEMHQSKLKQLERKNYTSMAVK